MIEMCPLGSGFVQAPQRWKLRPPAAALADADGSALAQTVEDLPGLGEAAGLVLGVEQLAVDNDIELAVASDLELGDYSGLFLDRGRETRGLGLVVSHPAVLDRDLHGDLLGSKRHFDSVAIAPAQSKTPQAAASRRKPPRPQALRQQKRRRARESLPQGDAAD